MSYPDDCCGLCLGCGRTVCYDARPSPGEPDVCDDCFILDNPEGSNP